MSPDQLARMAADAMYAKDNAAHIRGYELRNVGAGTAEFTFRVEPRSLNALALCDGGELFALAETAFLYAANSFNRRTVSQSASITFLAQAQQDDILTAKASLLHRSGRSATYVVELRNQHGALIAELRGQARAVRGEWVQSFAP